MCILFVIEWLVAAEHCVDDTTSRPHIYHLSRDNLGLRIRIAVEYFWCTEGQCACICVHLEFMLAQSLCVLVLTLKELGHIEVSYLQDIS